MNKTKELTLDIDGIALKQETQEKSNWLPDIEGQPQYPPYTHQVEMKELIENNDEFVVTNSTMTGGGKTESHVLPVLKNNLFSVILFPTNALIADQYQSIKKVVDNYYEDDDVFIKKLNSDTMKEYREKKREQLSLSSLKNSVQIQQALLNAKRNDGPSFILTNPDVFTGILNGHYHASTRQQLQTADMIVVDEFHHAQPKGKNALMIKMDLLHHLDSERNNLNKFVFLSATPDENVKNQLDNKFGLPSENNLYTHIDSSDNCKDLSKISESEPFNPVMPPLNMKFIGSRPFSTKDKILSEEYFAEIISFITEGRSLVILDGVAEVNDVHSALNNALPKYKVDKITGITSDNTNKKLKESDIIVANSTLEVGVDIDSVERLVFTGYNADSFMQRIGRLRAESKMNEKSAICFTSPSAIESFKVLNEFNYNKIPRELFEQTVNRTLNKKADIDVYRSEFTAIEMYNYVQNIHNSMYDGKGNYLENAKKIIAKHCFEDLDYNVRKSDIQEKWNLSKSEFGNAMQSYRQSSLTALYYDVETDSVKTYSIPSLLRIGDVEFLTESEFDYRLKSQGIANPKLYDSEKQYVQTYAWFNGFYNGEKLRNPHVVPSSQLKHMVTKKPENRKPQLINSIEFTVENTDGIKGLDTLNNQLHTELNSNSTEITGYITEGHPSEIQKIYGLDEFFFTNPIANMNGEYTMALGENAQYLYCHVQENLYSAKQLYNQYTL